MVLESEGEVCGNKNYPLGLRERIGTVNECAGNRDRHEGTGWHKEQGAGARSMTSPKKITYTSLDEDEDIHHAYEYALDEAEASLGKQHPLLIGGKERFSQVTFTVRSPIDQKILGGHFQASGKKEIYDAISEASDAFPAWESLGSDAREQIIRAAAGELAGQQYLLAALITIEAGKNRNEALAEVSESIDMLTYYTGMYRQNKGYQVLMGRDPGDNSSSISLLRPFGVFVVISPFNFPLALAAGMIGAALLTGNTVVFKPPSEAPLTALHLYNAFIRAGVPPGALHYLTSPGPSFGDAITGHPGVAGIAFTGSRNVGRWLQQEFTVRQPYPKPFISETGSKNPVIITARADLDRAIEGVTRSAFGYGGQKCSAASRLYVEAPIIEMVLDRLKERVAQIMVGDPRKREVFIGPLINEHAMLRFRGAVEDAKVSGGRIVTGGDVLTSGYMARGFYVTPTIVTGLPRGHHLWQDELFLPLLLVDSYTTLPDALEQANATEFGLTAGIFSQDPEEIEYFFAHIQSGVCYANRRGGATTGAWPGRQSFGGWKASGSTGRGVGGPYYLLSFLREQSRTG